MTPSYFCYCEHDQKKFHTHSSNHLRICDETPRICTYTISFLYGIWRMLCTYINTALTSITTNYYIARRFNKKKK